MKDEIRKIPTISLLGKDESKFSEMQIVQSLLRDVCIKDPCTFYHSHNVGLYVYLVSEFISDRYGVDVLNNRDLQVLVSSALLHDVGKILIPSAILTKSGPLTCEEFKVMKTHPERSNEILNAVADVTGKGKDFFRRCGEIARTHHEYMDGTGYARNLPNTSIDLYSRIITICDIYEALSASRSYRPAKTSIEAILILSEQFKGKVDEVVLESLEYIIRRMN